MNMDKKWHIGVNKLALVATLGDDAPALSTVQTWAAEFKRGREQGEP